MSKISNFTYKEAVIKPYKDNFFYTTEELNYSWAWENQVVSYEVSIPKGFITDLSSCYRIPVLGKTIFKTNTCNQSVAILHDYLCRKGAIVRKVWQTTDEILDSDLYTMTKQSEADEVLCEAIKYQYNLYNGKDIGESSFRAFQEKLIKAAISLAKWRKDPIRIYNEQKQCGDIG